MKCLIVIFCCLLVGMTMSTTDTYKAGIVNSRNPLGSEAYAQLIQDAAKANVDILVLPTPENADVPSTQADNYDEVVKALSSLAKQNNIYVVSHLYEKMRCQEKTELVRSNLVFNRQGAVISAYRKPVATSASCNASATEIGSFITDFGVTFGVLMPEDPVLQNLEGLKDVRNFIMAGEWQAEIPVLAAPHFYTTWAYTTNANLVSTAGVFAGKAGLTGHGTGFVVADLKKDGEASIRHPIINTNTAPSEDLSRYIIKPLDLTASRQGVRETVCHGRFCCEFYVKTTSTESQILVNYGLAAFEGIRHYGGQHNIGTQTCALLPCVGSYKRACDAGSVNNTNVIFDEVTITGNFKLKNSAQFPIVLSTDAQLNNQFGFDKKCVNNTSRVTVKLYGGQKLLNFGIFGRDFARDYEAKTIVYNNTDELTYKIYEYINSEDVQDFVDYVWIRLRVLIFVVSIYVLEMM